MTPGLPTPRLTARINPRTGAVTIDGQRGRMARRTRLCSGCNKPGHDIRRCPKEHTDG